MKNEAYNKAVGEKIVKRYDKFKSEMGVWLSHWAEVTRWFIPKKDNVYGHRTEGEQRDVLVYDSTPIHAAELLASALHGMLTNPTSVWFGLSTGNPDIDREDDVRGWLQDCADRMVQVMNNSNFQTEIHEVYMDLVTLGTSALRTEEDEEDIVRFTARPIYESVIAENYKNVIDTIYYEYDMTLEQIVEQFGNDSLPEDFLRRVKEEPLAKEKIIHCIEPRKKYSQNTVAPKKMPFASYHVLKCLQLLLKESGFKENPYCVARFSKIAGETFGRSPAMKALPDAQMLNKMKKATIEAAQLQISPPVQVPDDGVLLPVKLKPKSTNYYRAGTKDRIEPINFGSNIGLGEQMMEKVRTQILQAFYIDQLQLAQNDRMTTVEVTQRRDEQLRLLSPLLGRLHHELLKPMIDRVFSIMMRRKLFAQPPEKLSGAALEIRYTSMIAKAQLAAEGDNFQRFMSMVAPMLQLQPNTADKLNGDEIVEYGSTIYGVPHRLIRKDSEVEIIRQGKMEAAKQQEMMMQEQHDAKVGEMEAKAGTEQQQ